MKLFFSLVLGLLLYGCGRTSPPAAPAPRTQWNPLPTDVWVTPRAVDPKKICETFLEALPPEYEQGSVSVLENWSDPSSPRIDVFYYWNSAEVKTKDAIVFFNGGPTIESHGSFTAMREKIAAKKIPMVFIDQRGTGCSTPYPSEINETNAKRLAHYGSKAIVRDAEVIREKLLGVNKKWKAYGQSAGGWMVQRYVEMAPQSLLAAYAHGAAFAKDAVEEFVFRIQAQQRIGDLYFKKYPDDRRIIEQARKRVPDALCFTDGTSRICGPGVLDALVFPLAFPASWAAVHEWIVAADYHEHDYFLSWVRGIAQAFFFNSYLSHNGFAASVVGLVEASLVDDEDVCVAAQRVLEQQGLKPAELPFNECRLSVAFEQKWNNVVAVVTKREPYKIENVQKRLEEFPGLKFFLYAGALDPLVPSESFTATVNQLKGRVTFSEFKDSGHDGFYTEEKIWSDLQLK